MVAAVGTVLSCSSVPEYPVPADIPKEYENAGLHGHLIEECPQISGQYSDSGDNVKADGVRESGASLSRLLGMDGGDRVNVDFGSDRTLKFESVFGGEILESRSYPNEKFLHTRRPVAWRFMCTNGRVMVGLEFKESAAGTVGPSSQWAKPASRSF